MTTTVGGVRDVMTLDGEGYSPHGNGGPHWYTLLNAYDSRRGGHWAIREWESGLSTGAILRFLVSLPATMSTLCCGFFLNYDVTMWLKNLSPDQLTALWRGGWVIWRDEYETEWWIEWIPSKLFFVGQWTPELGIRTSKWHWPGAHRMIYDVGGFSQKSFVATLAEWKEEIGISNVELAYLAEQKAHRSAFSESEREEIETYNQRECVWLARYVQALDKTFQGEGIKLNAWHGPGALASHYLKEHRVDHAVRDPEDYPGVLSAIMHAYFGGRSECMQIGRFDALYNYDINSAYPAACILLPDLVRGEWVHVKAYWPEVYGLWHVRWDLRDRAECDNLHVMPFPVRWKGAVLYPDAGEGWYHGVEVDAVLRGYGQEGITILEGWIYVPDTTDAPLVFVRELADKRVEYKKTDPKRSVPYKYALNSLYGKFAQHTAEQGRRPRWQSYYAAGYITAATRAALLNFVWQEGHTDADVVMLATDGVFCTRERSWGVGPHLGQFEYQGTREGVYVVQPGVWYEPGKEGQEGAHRTRGFGARSVTYDDVRRAFEENGYLGRIPYQETRFVGLGSCAGWGDFSQYGRWVETGREVVFYPPHKFIRSANLSAPSYRLSPTSLPGFLSEPYVPAPPNDSELARRLWEESAERVEEDDQPDREGEV